MTRRPAVTQAEIGDDTPLRLADAVLREFPSGGMTVCGLRGEAAKGRLAIMRIAGKDFVTRAAIREMQRKCLVNQKARTFGFDPPAETPLESSSSAPDGSSRTEAVKSAQDALRETVKSLKQSSRPTSPRNTTRRAGSGAVDQSRSRTC